MSASFDPDCLAVLRPAPAGTTLLITIGNPLRKDDGVGSYLAAALGAGTKGYRVQDAGDRPENVLETAVAVRPAKVIFVDAADFGGRPGEARVLARRQIPEATLSTHTFPLPVIAGLLELDCGAEVHFLGIQPQAVGLGEGLSPAVRAAAEHLIRIIRKEMRHA